MTGLTCLFHEHMICFLRGPSSASFVVLSALLVLTLPHPAAGGKRAAGRAADLGDPGLPVVDSLTRAFEWADDMISIIERVAPQVLQYFRHTLSLPEEATMSTAFSGVDATGHALENILHALHGDKVGDCSTRCSRKRSPRIQRGPAWSNLFAIEWLGHSQDELLLADVPPQCLFGDIHSFIDSRVYRSVLSLDLEKLTFDDLQSLMWRNGLVQTYGDCLTHGRRCPLRKAQVHMAGTPCTDWSHMGKRMGAVGAAMLAFMLWVVHRALLQESIVIQDSIVKVQCSKHIILIGLHNPLIIMLG